MSRRGPEDLSQSITPKPVESITTIVRARSESTDVEAAVLRAVAQRSDSIALPDVLELRSLLDADDEQADTPKARVAIIINAIDAELAGWDRREALV
ncbi:hypothetical protein Harman_42010 [Haloarcula mannanilytica]|uniref:Uncharacterized protein n=1 Tax=Haloarcula mannanilytica TaxID=2509225 RepID=A0A4C2EPH5_9EURY|nr:hypothetical protein [Haloarcula mannanilytica]GCF16266.1 hypothetical protein Harman_42010 [Haloarcula mannanilytica]